MKEMDRTNSEETLSWPGDQAGPSHLLGHVVPEAPLNELKPLGQVPPSLPGLSELCVRGTCKVPV